MPTPKKKPRPWTLKPIEKPRCKRCDATAQVTLFGPPHPKFPSPSVGPVPRGHYCKACGKLRVSEENHATHYMEELRREK